MISPSSRTRISLTAEDVDAVIAVTRKTLVGMSADVFREQLTEITGRYLTQHVYRRLVSGSRLAPSQAARKARGIVTRSRKLREALKHDKQGIRTWSLLFRAHQLFENAWELADQTTGPRPRRPSTLTIFFSSRIDRGTLPQELKRLQLWAERRRGRAEAQTQINVRRGTKRHQGDIPLHHLLGDLAGLWIDAFKEVPGMSFGPVDGKSSRPRGPFVRFLKEVLSLIRSRLADQPLGADRALMRSLSPSDWALRDWFYGTGISRLKSL
jgi:hypothetical protein